MLIEKIIPSIAIGMQSGELGEFLGDRYNTENLTKNDIIKVHNRVKETKAYTFKKTIPDALDKIREFSITDEITIIEVFGTWQAHCIYDAVRFALDMGLDVQVPKEYIFNHQNYSKTLVEQIIDDNKKSKELGLCDIIENDKYYHFSLKNRTSPLSL